MPKEIQWTRNSTKMNPTPVSGNLPHRSPSALQGEKNLPKQGDLLLPELHRERLLLVLHVFFFSDCSSSFFQKDTMYFWCKKCWSWKLHPGIFYKLHSSCVHWVNKETHPFFLRPSFSLAVISDCVTIPSTPRDVPKVYPSYWPPVKWQLTKSILSIRMLRLKYKSSKMSTLEIQNTEMEKKKKVTPVKHLIDPEEPPLNWLCTRASSCDTSSLGT